MVQAFYQVGPKRKLLTGKKVINLFALGNDE
jgi:hypothetical protein